MSSDFDNLCPTPSSDGVSPDKMAAAQGQVMNAMNIPVCNNQSSRSEGGGAALVPMFPPLIAAGYGMSESTSSVGCEQINAIVNTVAKSQEVINCVVNQQKISTNVTLLQANDITINIGVGVGANIDLSQINKSDVYIVSNLSASQTTSLENILKDSLTQLADNIQDSKSDWASTPEGQKNLKAFSTLINQKASNQSISQYVNNFKAFLKQTNNVTINLTGYDPITIKYAANAQIKNIKIDQENVTNFRSQQLMNTVLTDIFGSDIGQEFAQNLSNNQSSVNKGPPPSPLAEIMGGSQTFWIAMMVLGGLFFIVIIFMIFKTTKSE